MTKHSYSPEAPLTESQRQLGFRIHAMVFVPVILAQLLINYIIGGYPWSLWPLAGWSIGLLTHWFFVFGPGARHVEQD